MSLREYMQLVRHGRWWIVAGLLLGSLAGAIVTTLTPPTYAASTTLYFAAIEGGGEPGQAYQGSLLALEKARVYAQLLTTDRILAEVEADTGESVPADAILVQATAGSPVLTVEGRGTTPERATEIANSVAQRAADLVSELEQPRDSRLSTVVTLRQIARAVAPMSPVAPDPVTNVALGTVLGLALGFAAALVRRHLDQSLRTSKALEELTDVPVLGSIPAARQARSKPFVSDVEPRGPVAESVRQLRVILESLKLSTSLLVTSAQPGEGKTTVARELAASFTLTGQRVLLVDANLYGPLDTKLSGPTQSGGLTSVLTGQRPWAEVVERGEGRSFDLLPRGTALADTTELLDSTRMGELLAELRQQYDVVLVDAPALLSSVDASVLARRCDAILLVVRHGRTSGPDVEMAVAKLRAISAHLLGCVFTMVPTRRGRGGSSSRRRRSMEQIAPAPSAPARVSGSDTSIPPATDDVQASSPAAEPPAGPGAEASSSAPPATEPRAGAPVAPPADPSTQPQLDGGGDDLEKHLSDHVEDPVRARRSG